MWLMEHFHLVRDREILAEIMEDWIHLETDGHALYELVKRINEEFDQEFVRRREQRNTKAALMCAANAAQKADQ